jgi:protein TonB
VLVVGLLAAAFAGGYAWKDWNGGRFDLGSGNVDRAKADHPVTPRPPATAAAKPKPQDPVAGPIAGAIGNTTATAPATATTSPAAAANSGSQQPAAQPPASAAGAGSQSNLQRPPSGHELRILHQEMLELPQAAKDLGIGTGHVEVLLHVNAQGTVEQVELIHADPPQVYDQAMAQAFGRWTFEPPGVPGRMTVEVEVTPPEKKP